MITFIKRLCVEIFDMIFMLFAAILSLLVFFVVSDGLYGSMEASPWVGAAAAIITAILSIFVYIRLSRLVKNLKI